jgi:DNA-binding beta-propeller fold protein YncE
MALATLSPCAKWNQTGVTVAGKGHAGNSSFEISGAKGIFIHRERNALYVADFDNNRVQMFSPIGSSTMGITVASGIENPMKVYVDEDDGPIVYVSLRFLNRVEKWIKGASKGVQVGDTCILCSGVSVDTDKNVYMSESERHRVIKWSPHTNTSTVIAGKTNTSGSANALFDHPQGIHVTRDGSAVYVADMWNNRIQKWPKYAPEGFTVAGNKTEGPDNTTLDFPNDVFVDEETNVVYVMDTNNHRVQRWLPNAMTGDTIVGGTGKGNATNQLNKPTDLAFDMVGNLYICDMDNNRIQKFTLIDNRPCS